MKYEDFSKGYITFLTQFQKEKTSPEEAQFQYRSLKKGGRPEAAAPILDFCFLRCRPGPPRRPEICEKTRFFVDIFSKKELVLISVFVSCPPGRSTTVRGRRFLCRRHLLACLHNAWVKSNDAPKIGRLP